MKTIFLLCIYGAAVAAGGTPDPKLEEARELKACVQALAQGLPKIPDDRAPRFQGKVSELEAICRGERNLQFRLTPWVDWSQYWGTGDMSSLAHRLSFEKGPAFRGVSGRPARSRIPARRADQIQSLR